jgi:hypothetical protein
MEEREIRNAFTQYLSKGVLEKEIDKRLSDYNEDCVSAIEYCHNILSSTKSWYSDPSYK